MSDFEVTVTPPIVYTVTVENIPPANIDILLSPEINVDITTPGPQGIPGPGVPIGGTTNQALTKVDGTNYNTQWSTIDKTFVGLGNVQNLDQTDPTNIAQDSTHRFVSDVSIAYWNAKQDALGYTAENLANKSTSVISDQGSNTKYPSVRAVFDWASATFQAALGFTPENVTNKATNLTSPDNTKYPTTLAVYNAISSVSIPDATTTTKGIVKLAGDLSGTADLPTVPGLAGKEPTITAGTTSQYWRGDKTFQTLDKSAVGLSNVDNTSDASKPISTDTQTALDNKVSYADMQKTQLAYVSPSGSNTTGDGSFARPYLTIAYAISNTLDGSTIFLLPGLYTEATVVIPASTGSRSFRGFSASSTELQNGIIHTASAFNINFSFDSININSATLDESAAINGFVYFTRCWFNVTRIDSNPNVVFTNTESNVSGASLSGSNNVFNEALVLGVIVCSGGFNVFENCKFVATLEAQGTALIRMLDCGLFGASFINGTIVSGNTPSWEVDLATDYLGGYTGDINKTILVNFANLTLITPTISGFVPYTDGASSYKASLNEMPVSAPQNLNSIVNALIFG